MYALNISLYNSITIQLNQFLKTLNSISHKLLIWAVTNKYTHKFYKIHILVKTHYSKQIKVHVSNLRFHVKPNSNLFINTSNIYMYIYIYLPGAVASKVKATRNLPGFSSSGSTLKLSFFTLTSFLIVTAF